MSHSFLALALRQSLITRWSLRHNAQRESVMEHSAIVGLLSMLAGNLAQSIGKDIDIGVLLSHALLHDVQEVLVSDLATPVKRATPELYEQFKKLEQTAATALINRLPDPLVDSVTQAIEPGGYEQKLVKACDIYASYIKCCQEVRAGNVHEFEDALTDTEHRVQQVVAEFEEMNMLHNYFGESFGQSLSTLLDGYRL